MPNHVRTHPDGVWVDGYTLLPEDWTDLERKVFWSWNGDKGGSYGPSRLRTGGAWSFGGAGLQIQGPTRLTYGGAIRGGAGAFIIRDGVWPELATTHRARNRSIVCPIESWSVPPIEGASTSTAPPRLYMWTRNHPYMGVGSIALACRQTHGRTIETPELYIPLRVIDGAVLSKVTLVFRVASKRAVAPIAMPRLRILRVPRDTGNVYQTVLPQPLKSSSDGRGFDFAPLATTPDAWYSEGQVQTFEYVCDQHNVIDVSKYSYVAHLIEEVGALTPDDPFDGVCFVERKPDVFVVGTNGTSLNGNQSCDGRTTASGNRILVVDSDPTLSTGEPDPGGASAKNGIWVAGGADWTRATDADESGDFSPNWIVRALSGDVNMGATWQCAFPSTANRIDLQTANATSLSKTQIRIQPAEPRGNIYHALVPTFEVSDLRFQ